MYNSVCPFTEVKGQFSEYGNVVKNYSVCTLSRSMECSVCTVKQVQ